MALESHIRELDARHRAMDAQIEAEMRRPAADPIRIAHLKRQKLRLKEEIAALRSRLPN